MAINRRIISQLLSVLLANCLLLAVIPPSTADTFNEAYERGKRLQDAGDDDGAINAYVLAAEIAPDPFNDARLRLARLYTKLGRYNDADNEWVQILSHSNDVNLKYEYGRFLTEQGRFNSALAFWSNMLNRNPNDSTTLYYKGLCLEATDNIDSAQECYKKAIQQAPTQQQLIIAKDPKYEEGKALVSEGKFGAAATVWTDILTRYPSDRDPVAHYFLGVCMEGNGHPSAAFSCYQSVLRLGSDTQAGQMVSARLSADKLARLGHANSARIAGKFFPVDLELGVAGLGWWNLKKMPIHVYIDDGSGITGYRQEMKQHVSAGLESWRQASGGKFSFVIDPPDSKGEIGWTEAFGKDIDPETKLTRENMSLPDDPVKSDVHLHWTSHLAGALGLAWTNVLANKTDQTGMRDCLIHKGHIWLNTDSLADGSPLPIHITSANVAILERQDRMMGEVAIHEMGHILGLPHSPNPHDIMCSGIFALNSTDLVEGRMLSKGDLGSLSEHYNRFEGTGLPEKAIIWSKLNSGAANTAGSMAFHGLRPNSASKTVEVEKPVPKHVSEIDRILFDINSKEYARGLSQVNHILSTDPSNPELLYLRAVIYVLTRSYKEAAGDYQKVIELSPGSVLARRAQEGLSKISSH